MQLPLLRERDLISTLWFGFIGANVEVLTQTNELQGVFFQDQHMKLSYQSSPEFVCMDATYKLLEAGFSVFILMCEDGGGNYECSYKHCSFPVMHKS